MGKNDFEEAIEENREILRKKTAEDLMNEASELGEKIIDLIGETDLTTTVVIGVLENIKHTVYRMHDATIGGLIHGRR